MKLADALQSVPIARQFSAFRPVDPELGTIQCHDVASLQQRDDRLSEQGTQLIAVRHAESVANAEGNVLSGRGDSPLTEQGKRQAGQVARQLLKQLGGSDWLIKAAHNPQLLPILIASPLSRAFDTGLALVQLLHQEAAELQKQGQISPTQLAHVEKVSLQAEPDLQEIDFGECEGRHVREVAQAYPNFGRGLDFTHRFPGGESGIDVMMRVDRFLNRVEAQHAGDTVIFFAHTMTVGISQMLLGEVTHNPEGSLTLDRSKIPNADPIVLTQPRTPLR